MTKSPRRRSFQGGQGMVEYAPMVFFIVIVAIQGIVFLVPMILHGLSGALPALEHLAPTDDCGMKLDRHETGNQRYDAQKDRRALAR